MHHKIDILVATTSGNTEYLADQLAAQLQQDGFTTELHYEPDYQQLTSSINQDSVWLCCVACHGAGDYADSMLDFAEQLHSKQPDLKPLRYGVIAIGDSCYDTYCAAGRDCDEQLAKAGAQRLQDRLEIDMSIDDPAKKASTWARSFTEQMCIKAE
ncbi:flavodoxin domain-containing protein [Pseudidiomarina sp.]|uniref:flavodoxin domain-containing protein n=1 Tax=Pseudidiomarina sp. TaxID=2081707 RepID=UPI00299EC7F6|nr:flavodoxin domain-containing protein [Pseudidiomarina sp.]MDX1705787.1 flavodoxin domain-containing protein [Pseudidiomarina sp.]